MTSRCVKKDEAADWPHLTLGAKWVAFLRKTRCTPKRSKGNINLTKTRRYGAAAAC